jgi:DNA-binding Lrp family transcriptional regulator
MDLDDVDRRILTHLQDNARVSNVELAQHIGLSPAPCLRRVRALENAGVITKYGALLDEGAVGLPVSVHIQVRLDLQVAKRFDLFESQIVRRPEVLECYLLTGVADYLLRVVVHDVAAYEAFLKQSLSRMDGVVSTHSSFGLRVVKRSMSLRLLPDRATEPRARRSSGRREPAGRSNAHPPMPRAAVDLDQIDRHLLMRLQENARISNVDLANSVGLSPAPCLRRVRALERNLIVRQYVSLLDPRLVDLPTMVWIQVRLDLQVARRFNNFEGQVRRLPEVLECYLMAGEADYLVRVIVRDVAGYERFLRTRLSQIEGVVSTNSSFVLKVVKYSTALPLIGRADAS